MLFVFLLGAFVDHPSAQVEQQDKGNPMVKCLNVVLESITAHIAQQGKSSLKKGEYGSYANDLCPTTGAQQGPSCYRNCQTIHGQSDSQ